MLFLGFDGCAGILYMNFRDRYQQSAAISAWLGSLATALRLTLGKSLSFKGSLQNCEILNKQTNT